MAATVYGSRIVTDVTLKSLSPYSQSRAHDEPAYENESKADYDRRTWQSHLHVENGTVRIPAKAFHDCWIEAAEYSGKKISGNRTWTKPFTSGIAIFENPDLGIKPEDVQYIDVFCHANGKRGSGTRVMRRFPQIPHWERPGSMYTFSTRSLPSRSSAKCWGLAACSKELVAIVRPTVAPMADMRSWI